MNRTITKLLEQRVKLAMGSLSLVDKQLSEILYALDSELEKSYDDTLRGEKENSDQDFFISPPIELYDEH